jgi:hypothetical protein
MLLWFINILSVSAIAWTQLFVEFEIASACPTREAAMHDQHYERCHVQYYPHRNAMPSSSNMPLLYQQ